MGPIGLISCQRKNPETNSGEGSCLQSSCFQPWMRADIPPALLQPPLRQEWSLCLPTGRTADSGWTCHWVWRTCASATKEDTPRDGHPHYPQTQEVGLLVHKESADHLCFPRSPYMVVTHKLSSLQPETDWSVLVWCQCWAAVHLLVSARISILYPEDVQAHCDIGQSDLLVADLGEFAGWKLVGKNKKKLIGDLEMAARHNIL